MSMLVFVLSYDSNYCNAFESFKLIMHGKFWHVASWLIIALVSYCSTNLFVKRKQNKQTKNLENIRKEIMM